MFLKWQNIFVQFDQKCSINVLTVYLYNECHTLLICIAFLLVGPYIRVKPKRTQSIEINRSILIVNSPGEEESLWVSTFQLHAWHHQHPRSDARRDEGEGGGGAVARIVTWSIWNMYLVSWLITPAFLLSCTWPLGLTTNLREVS